ncbi:MAG: LysM peptidoglycan-binding domain-containing protein, partial [Chloroflexota bacterium]
MKEVRWRAGAWSGHVVLLVIAFLLIVGGRLINTVTRHSLGDRPGEDLPSIAEPAGEPSSQPQLATAPGYEHPTPQFDMAEIPVLADTALHPELNPITYRPQRPHHELITYTVQTGDTAVGIAEQFGIREETILGGNSFLQNNAAQLWAGTDIVILPVDGVLHNVVEGDTLEGLAEKYGVEADEIIAYDPNNLTFPFRLVPGTQILVPGAIAEVWYWDPPS